MLFIGAAARPREISSFSSGLMVNVPTPTRAGVELGPGLRTRGALARARRHEPAP